MRSFRGAALIAIALALTCPSCGGVAADPPWPTVAPDTSPCARPRGVLTSLVRYSDTPGLFPQALQAAAVVGDATYLALSNVLWRSAAPSTPAVKLANVDNPYDLVVYGGGVWWGRALPAPSGVSPTFVIERFDEAAGTVASFSVTDSDCPATPARLAYSDNGVIAFGSCLWALTYEDGALRKRRLAAKPAYVIDHVYVHGDNVYFTDPRGVVEAGIANAHDRVIPNTPSSLHTAVVVDDDYLYTTTYPSGASQVAPYVRQDVDIRTLRDGALYRTLHLDVETQSLFLAGDALFLDGSKTSRLDDGGTWRVSKNDGHGDLLVGRATYASDRCALYFSTGDGISYYAP